MIEAGTPAEPAALARRLWHAAAVLAAALFGLGVILWLAANWDDLGRIGRFALLQATILVLCAGAVWRPRMRVPLALLALLCIGGLFAYFGQTYQTGADAWQLFALWAVLALPLCLGARSDALWAPWALVVCVAIALWTYAHTGHAWRARSQDGPVFLAGWLACAALVAALGPAAARWTGAGVWALRTAGTLGVAMVTLGGIFALFHDAIAAQYGLAVLLFAVAAAVLALPRMFEIFLLSAVALGLDTLLVAGLARAMFTGAGRQDPVGRLLVIGIAAAALLAVSVSLVTRLAKRQAQRALA